MGKETKIEGRSKVRKKGYKKEREIEKRGEDEREGEKREKERERAQGLLEKLSCKH